MADVKHTLKLIGLSVYGSLVFLFWDVVVFPDRIETCYLLFLSLLIVHLIQNPYFTI